MRINYNLLCLHYVHKSIDNGKKIILNFYIFSVKRKTHVLYNFYVFKFYRYRKVIKKCTVILNTLT